MKKTYLILGASSDIGLELIHQLIAKEDEKDTIIIAHYNSNGEQLIMLRDEDPKRRIRLLQADMSCAEQVQDLIDKINMWELEVTHIVNLCANTFVHTRLKFWDSDIVNKDMRIQVYSFAEILRAFVPQMGKRGYGKIVAMLTAYTIGTPPKNMSGYVTVKYALLGLIKSVASDYGDKGVNINGISPGMINTKFVDGIGRKIKEMSAEGNPKHRNLETKDVVPMILFLLSEQAEFISGTNINMSGETD